MATAFAASADVSKGSTTHAHVFIAFTAKVDEPRDRTSTTSYILGNSWIIALKKTQYNQYGYV